MGQPGKLPEIYNKIEVNVHLLTRLLGVRQRTGSRNPETVQDIKKGEVLLVNVGSTATGGKASPVPGSNIISFELISNPVCAEIGEKIAISRRIEDSWRLIGWGIVLSGVAVKIDDMMK